MSNGWKDKGWEQHEEVELNLEPILTIFSSEHLGPFVGGQTDDELTHIYPFFTPPVQCIISFEAPCYCIYRGSASGLRGIQGPRLFCLS